MNEDSLKGLAKVMDAVRNIHLAPPVEPNFFDVGGKGYLEKPTSVLMALFMGMETPYVQPWLAKSLVACFIDKGLADKDFEMVWDNVKAECEVSILGEDGSSKFLDILIYDGTNVIGIENKVYASSDYNPFSDYSRLLDQHVSAGGTVLKCILQAYSRKEGVRRQWPIIVYSELVEKAFERYGQDVLNPTQSKWQFYYQEFLHHLTQLSGEQMAQQLNHATINFIHQNFEMLEKSVALLQAFKDDLTAEASLGFRQVLSESTSQEVTIKTAHGKWDDEKMLRFFPSIWGKNSQIAIGYYADSEEGVEGKIGFRIYAFISNKDTPHPLQDVEKAFRRAIDGKMLASTMTPCDYPDKIAYEERGKLLRFSMYPTSYTRAGAIKAAKDLALWVQENAFESQLLMGKSPTLCQN